MSFYAPVVLSWFGVCGVSIYGTGCIPTLKAIDRPPDDSGTSDEAAPLVSILVPARNEERNIENCLRSVLASDYPNFEVLVAEGRSADRTAEIVEKIAAQDSRVRLVDVPPLPAGWAGKPFALSTISCLARGEWMLFLDADALIHPQNVRASLDEMRTHQIDVLSQLAAMRSETLAERWIQPLAAIGCSLFFRLDRVNDERFPDSALISGQFILFRRTAYERMGGHEAVRGELMEDVAIAKLVKQLGMRLRLVSAPTLLAVRMYATLGEMLNGWGRIYHGSAGRQVWKIVALWLATVCLSLSAFAMSGVVLFQLLSGHDMAPLMPLVKWNVLHHVLIVIATIPPYRRAGASPLALLGYLPACLMVVAALTKAMWISVTKKVTWRGVTYQPAAGRPQSKITANSSDAKVR